MRTRLGVGLSTSFLLVVLLLTAVPIMAQHSADTPAVRDEAAIAPMLAADIQELKAKADRDERVTVVIKLQGASLSRASQDMVIAQLKRQAIQSQEVLLDFLHREGAVVLNTFWLTNAVLAEVPVNRLDAIASLPGVERLFENFTVTVPEPLELEETDCQPDTVGDVTWGLDKIGVPDVWDLGHHGAGIRVAVLDTGVDISHPDLAGRMYTDDGTDPTYHGGWAEFDADGNIVAGSEPYDSHWHGTHVSGTVLGGDASGYSIGVAPGACLMHGLVLPGGKGTWAQVIAGMEWAVDPYDYAGNPAGERADVLNMSLGATGKRDALIAPVENARAAGVVVIASIGNDDEGTSGSPGNVYECFGIGATDEYDYVATFSGGEEIDWAASHPEPYIKPDFSAPGVLVLSAHPEGWSYGSGTSMAAPHVAGVVVLMLEANPALTVDDIYDILKNTAVWYDRYYQDRPCTRYGCGRIDAFEAVLLAALDSGIEGVVTDADTGDPIEGAKVVVDTDQTRHTDELGYYRFLLPAGPYVVDASAFGYYTDAAVVGVVEDQFTSQDFALAPIPTGFIEGTVTYQDTGDPIQGASITLPGTPLSTTTNGDGHYVVEAPIGTYDVMAEAPGYAPTTVLDVEVIEGETVTVDFALEIAPWADWRWLYDAGWRPEAENAIGLTDPGTWYAGMRIDLSDDMGEEITQVAFYDYMDLAGNYSRMHVSPNAPGGSWGAPAAPWAGSTDYYYPVGAGWVEMDLLEPVLVEEPGHYWVVVEMQDPGGAYFSAALVAPSVPYADLVTWLDPHDPDNWDALSGLGLNYSVLVEARVVLADPPGAVAVLGDYESQVADLLIDHGFDAEERDWDVIDDITHYQVVVVSRAGDPGYDTFLEFLDAASDHGVGVIFTNQWPTPGVPWWAISLLVRHLGNPLGQDSASDHGHVYYEVTQAHPIFDGWEVGDEITLIETGNLDHAWFWDYSGEIIADLGTANVGIKGEGVGVGEYGGSTHILLASLGPQAWANMTHWTEDAKTVFINAVSYVCAVETGRIYGTTYEVIPYELDGVTIRLYKNGVLQAETTSDGAGDYALVAPEPGSYEVVATKDGFRPETRWVNVEDLEQEYDLNFAGNHGLIPNVLDGPYFAACMSTYLHAEGEFALSGPKFAAIMSAYLNPIEEA